MILSVSRRTDVPAFHAGWFAARMKEGFAATRNPMNPRQASRIELDRETIDAIVFWSKDPEPLLAYESVYGDIPHYFQFTFNAYDADFEPAFAGRRDKIADTFRRISDKLGPDYALKSGKKLAENLQRRDDASPLFCDALRDADKLSIRKVYSWKKLKEISSAVEQLKQMKLF